VSELCECVCEKGVCVRECVSECVFELCVFECECVRA